MNPVAGEEPLGAGASKGSYFTVINPTGQSKRIELASGPFTIGRQNQNQFVLRDNRVSRVHARLEREGGPGRSGNELAPICADM